MLRAGGKGGRGLEVVLRGNVLVGERVVEVLAASSSLAGLRKPPLHKHEVLLLEGEHECDATPQGNLSGGAMVTAKRTTPGDFEGDLLWDPVRKMGRRGVVDSRRCAKPKKNAGHVAHQQKQKLATRKSVLHHHKKSYAHWVILSTTEESNLSPSRGTAT